MVRIEEKPFKRQSCIGCIYHRRLGEIGSWGCHYMLDTGEPRGCPPEDCIHKTYEPTKRMRTTLQLRATKYFDECKGRVVHDLDGNPMRGKDGRLCIEGAHPPTVGGLALAMGFRSRGELLEKREDEQIGEVVQWALGKCEAYLEEKLYESANGIRLALQYNFPEWNDEKKEEENPGKVRFQVRLQ